MGICSERCDVRRYGAAPRIHKSQKSQARAPFSAARSASSWRLMTRASNAIPDISIPARTGIKGISICGEKRQGGDTHPKR